MGAFGTILTSILVFGFLIFIHEFGHYIFARIFKVTITEFSIGMGPKLVWYDSKKTGIRYALSAIPFGGYVAMEGENGGMEIPSHGDDYGDNRSDDSISETKNVEVSIDGTVESESVDSDRREKTEPFDKKPAWQRFIITVAGASVNIIAGFIAMIIFTSIVNIGTTTVYDFPENEYDISSEEAGLLSGDTIIKIDGKRVSIADELSYEIMRRGHKPVDVTVLRDGKELTLSNVVFPTDTESGQTFGMMDFRVYGARKSFGSVMKYSFFKTLLMVRMCWESLFDLITGRYTLDAVAGPVGTAGAISSAARSGLTTLLYLTVVITINLGVFNLLPLPPLDGGHVVYTLYEMVFRRPVPQKVATALDSGFSLLLFGFLIFITLKDIIGLF